MDLQTSIYENTIDPAIADDALPLWVPAKNFEEAGEFDRAAEAISPFWSGPSTRPNITGLTEEAQAELLLRAGTLTGWLGSAKQVRGAQERAKDLISESAALFKSLGMPEKVAEARVDLAICYWREGALDEARITLRLVLEDFDRSGSEQRLRAVLNSALVEWTATRDRDALKICTESAPL